jgi:hypothetical protein
MGVFDALWRDLLPIGRSEERPSLDGLWERVGVRATPSTSDAMPYASRALSRGVTKSRAIRTLSGVKP